MVSAEPQVCPYSRNRANDQVYVHDAKAAWSTGETLRAAVQRACDNAVSDDLDKLLRRVCTCHSLT